MTRYFSGSGRRNDRPRRTSLSLDVEQVEARQLLATFVVNSLADDPDVSPGDGICQTAAGECTLRAAIEEANALPNGDTNGDGVPDPDVILFGVSGRIQVQVTAQRPNSNALDSITDPLIIDGSGQPFVELNGLGAGPGADGLAINAGNSAVRGLIIDFFGGSGITLNSGNNTIGGTQPRAGNVLSANQQSGLHISGGSNLVQGNLIGTDPGGMGSTGIDPVTGQFAGLGNVRDGVFIDRGIGNTIGGTTAGSGNVISANFAAGIHLFFASDNLIQGNFLGTNRDGTSIRDLLDPTMTNSLGNREDGVFIDNSGRNTIGGATVFNDDGTIAVQPGNVISGNIANGIRILGTILPAATNNVVQGNLIGTDVTGEMFGLGNVRNGILIDQAPFNTIGSRFEQGPDGTVLLDEGDEMVPGPNPSFRVRRGNLISANGGNGIAIRGLPGSPNAARGTVIRSNYIGTDFDGLIDGIGFAGLSNNVDGINVDTAFGTVIGGPDVLDPGGRSVVLRRGNVVSFNLEDGIEIVNVRPPANDLTTIAGNFIGTDAPGTAALDNLNGVFINGSSNVLVGGFNQFDAGGTTILVRQGNIISANLVAGIVISGGRDIQTGQLLSNLPNDVRGNLIGTDPFGNLIGRRLASTGFGNQFGILLNEASGTRIGSDVPAGRNIISGNTGAGIRITGTAAVDANNVVQGNAVRGNYIGTDIAGTRTAANGVGVLIENANNLIGGETPNERNVISGNDQAGIQLLGAAATGNAVAGNVIGLNAPATEPLTFTVTDPGTGDVIRDPDTGLPDVDSFAVEARQVVGVLIENAGGNFVALGNLIAGNRVGLELRSPLAIGNQILGNFIGRTPDGRTRGTGGRPLGNFIGVLIDGGAANNTIGGTVDDGANVIAGNVSIGVALVNPATTGNVVQGNTIVSNGAVVRTRFEEGTGRILAIDVVADPAGSVLDPDTTLIGSGIYIDAARNNVIGARPTQAPRGRRGGRTPRPRPETDPVRNEISNNRRVGVYIFGGADGNSVRHNVIRNNGDYGAFVYNARQNVDDVILTGPDRNRIAGNGLAPFREFTGAVPQQGELEPTRRNRIIFRRRRNPASGNGP